MGAAGEEDLIVIKAVTDSQVAVKLNLRPA